MLHLERTAERAQLIRNAAETPHVALEVISATLQNLRRHEQRRADTWKRFQRLTAEIPAKT